MIEFGSGGTVLPVIALVALPLFAQNAGLSGLIVDPSDLASDDRGEYSVPAPSARPLQHYDRGERVQDRSPERRHGASGAADTAGFRVDRRQQRKYQVQASAPLLNTSDASVSILIGNGQRRMQITSWWVGYTAICELPAIVFSGQSGAGQDPATPKLN
jgi:hypothetical protein